ncbi:MAG TPA: recombinase family protein [Kofleriaceae bacterium]
MTAAIYARKSTEQNGVAEEQKSVARQIEHARAYASGNGWTVDDASVFVDDGISGAEFSNRPGFLRLMNALKPRPSFQVLIMSEESRLGREAIETAYALKQLVTAGVRVFFYLEDRERTLDSPTDKIMLSLTAFADELEREKARQRTYDAMIRKARAGHVTGGRVFGYDGVEVLDASGRRSHVERRINETEAAVIREIFDRCCRGEGLRAIAQALNNAGAVSPRAQQGRPHGWAPSSVRDVLHRELYRGVIVWNRTKKRDAWGRREQHDRPSAEWLSVSAESLRIISEDLWLTTHERFNVRNEAGQTRPQIGGRGIRRRYFLAGFARCTCCNGSIQAVSRASSGGRIFRYTCATYWNRGAAICPNGLTASMPVADAKVRDLLKNEVLKPRIVERALDLAIDMLRTDDMSNDARIARVERDLGVIDVELANLAETAARGGAVPAILEALSRRQAERQRLAAQLAGLQRSAGRTTFASADLRERLRGLLDDWQRLLSANASEARGVLDAALTDRIRFRPDFEERSYELTVPIGYDRLLTGVIPDLQGFQEMVSSPTGTERFLRQNLVVRVRAA